MEQTKTNVSATGHQDKSPESRGIGTHCPFWFFADEKSADKDLKQMFEIVDD